jgi:hypothetical protein
MLICMVQCVLIHKLLYRQGPIIELLTLYKAGTDCEDEALNCYKAATRSKFNLTVYSEVVLTKEIFYQGGCRAT